MLTEQRYEIILELLGNKEKCHSHGAEGDSGHIGVHCQKRYYGS